MESGLCKHITVKCIFCTVAELHNVLELMGRISVTCSNVHWVYMFPSGAALWLEYEQPGALSAKWVTGRRNYLHRATRAHCNREHPCIFAGFVIHYLRVKLNSNSSIWRTKVEIRPILQYFICCKNAARSLTGRLGVSLSDTGRQTPLRVAPRTSVWICEQTNRLKGPYLF